ncbi:MAG TPA: POTRA domain-containing protein [Bryobacteraceae bacterium]|jgi:outer membrane protein insertion porin family|nr:POTRA domain-containing protein [Bryobacteraceae bacterium]
MRVIFCAAVMAISLVSAAPAQENSPTNTPRAKRQPPSGPLHEITIRGNQLYPAAAIAQETGLQKGARVDSAILAKARDKLQATELFTSVAYEYRTSGGLPPAYDVTFQVAEDQQVFPTRFERLGMPADEIKACLRSHVDLYSDQIPGTQGILHRYASAVESCVAAKGARVNVKAAISNDDPKQLTVLFMPDTPAPTIAQVFVSGNQAVDTGTILRAVNQIAVGVPLTDTRLKMILEGTIQPLYASKGYAAVTFPKVETELSKTNLGVIVKVQIKDGPQFNFGSIRFRGSGLDEDEIRSTIPFRTGQTYNGDKVDSFRLDLTHKMRRRGLLDTSITTETQTDDSKRAVNVVYNVTPGAVYNFETLKIDGLDVTTEPVIEKLWGEKKGHPFNPDYPDYFLKRVQQEGLFDNLADARSDYTSDPATHNVIVRLTFKGGKSSAQRVKEKKEEEERRQSDGSWSPY